MLIIDIGCGQKKLPGSVGLDFSPFSMADHVVDLNNDVLPFDDNSVDYVYSSHALEHLSWSGFMNIVKEIYRVAKDDAQVFISVPYFHTRANLANPFHNNKIAFNEHTFRFFSSESDTDCMEAEDYRTPSCPDWGLRYSANQELEIEFRTLKIEFIYFDDYDDLDAKEQMRARRSYDNVVEVINYHLKVIKPSPRLITKTSQYDADFHELISRQLEYLDEQQQYLNSHPDVEEDGSFELAVALVFFERQGELYRDSDGVMYPSVEVHRKLHDLIQVRQAFIDALQQ